MIEINVRPLMTP